MVEEEKRKHNKAIGERLTEIMKLNEISEKELAEYLDRDETTIKRYKRGEITIPAELAVYLRERYRIDLNYLFCGDTPTNNVVDFMKGSGKNFYDAQMKRLKSYIIQLIYANVDLMSDEQ